MKKLLYAVLVLLLLSFVSSRQNVSSISGIINPSDAAVRVWAISSSDSVSTVPVAGKFSVTVKEGIWNLLVEAASPYANATMSGITVIDGQPNDVGTIELKKKE